MPDDLSDLLAPVLQRLENNMTYLTTVLSWSDPDTCPSCGARTDRAAPFIYPFDTGFRFCRCGFNLVKAVRAEAALKHRHHLFRRFRWYRRLVGGEWLGFGKRPDSWFWLHSSEASRGRDLEGWRALSSEREAYNLPVAKLIEK